MRADDRVRILHMRDAAEAVIEFVQGRNRIDIDKTVVWKTATVEIPKLLRNLQSILAESGG